jgi:uncharacterized peroxidase-related enzyme
MPHIEVPPGVPGISSLLMAYPETAKPLMALAQLLLRGPSTLTEGERELIAARVSSENACVFCAGSHGAAATELLGGDAALVAQVRADYHKAAISPKMKALLAIGDKVRVDGKRVTDADVRAARDKGATDAEIHQAVLIAAAFSMYNRYVDGLGTLQPPEGPAYAEMGKRLATMGYERSGAPPPNAPARMG